MLVRFITVPLTSVRVVLAAKNGLQIEKVSEKWQYCQKTQNNGWVKALVEQKMREDDERVGRSTTYTCHAERTWVQHSLRPILRCWTSLEWTYRGSKYCQLTCELKHFEWTWQYITESFKPSEVSVTSHGLMSPPCNWKAINSALTYSVLWIQSAIFRSLRFRKPL